MRLFASRATRCIIAGYHSPHCSANLAHFRPHDRSLNNPTGNWGQVWGNRPVRRGPIPCAFHVLHSIPYPPNCYSQTTRCFCIHASNARLITRRPCCNTLLCVCVCTCTCAEWSSRGACRRVIETLLIGFE